ncbi:MAG: hypothetical protein WCJ30_24225, partial [Deltaproteobacteria bacterium]
MIPRAPRLPSICCALLCAVGACDARGTPQDAGVADDSAGDARVDITTARDASDDVAVDAPPACPSDVDAQTGRLCVLDVRGRVLDLDGSPVGDNIVTVCGLQCYFGRSDATGTFVVTPAAILPWGQYVVQIHG